MKEIRESDFRNKLEEELVRANFRLREDVRDYLSRLRDAQKDPVRKKAVDVFVENARIAQTENRALCQDTGYVQLFLKAGRDVRIGFDIQKAADETVRTVYEKYYLRRSMADPLTRENTGTGAPVFIDMETTDGDSLDADVLIKGGGSENASGAGFLLPTAGEDEIAEWVTGQVRAVGAKACPPYILGVGVGGNLEKAVRESRKRLLERMDEETMTPAEKKLSEKIREKVNALPVGFQGLRFGETAMDVRVKTMPCHIATLPVAVAVGCNAVRQGRFRL